MSNKTAQTVAPKLRFPEFWGTPEWKRKRIGDNDFAQIYKGKGVSKSDISPDGKTPCIRYGELYTYYSGVIETVRSRTNIPDSKLFFSCANDVIIPASGETKIDIATASCVVDEGIALGGDLNVIRSKHNGAFLSYYLNGALRWEIARMAQGNSVVHLYPSQIEKVELFVPTPDEQKEIADCLSSIDELIEAERQKLEALQDHKKGLMQQLFPTEGETTPRLRFRAFRGAGDWEEKPLGKICKIVMGSSPKSSAYNEDNLGLPFLQGNADIKNRLSAPRIFTSQITKKCDIGDILLSVRAPVGTIAKSNHKACIGRGLSAIKVLGDSWQEFIYQQLLYSEPRWNRISQGGTFDAVNSEDIRRFLVFAPHPTEQQKIADCLSSIDELIEAEGQKLEALQDHKKGLMQQLFPDAAGV